MTLNLKGSPCRCGGEYAVVQHRGEFTIAHKNPICDAFNELTPMDFLAWVRQDPDLEHAPTPNRRQRRAHARAKRRQKKNVSM